MLGFAACGPEDGNRTGNQVETVLDTKWNLYWTPSGTCDTTRTRCSRQLLTKPATNDHAIRSPIGTIDYSLANYSLASDSLASDSLASDSLASDSLADDRLLHSWLVGSTGIL